MQVTGTIERVSEKSGTGSNGKPYTKYSVKVNGEWHNVGFDKPPFGEGQAVTFIMVQSGQYQNMQKGSMQPAQAATQTATTTGAKEPTDTQMQIMRQNAVTNANAFCAHSGYETDSNGIIALAEEFVRYYTGQHEREEAEDTFIQAPN